MDAPNSISDWPDQQWLRFNNFVMSQDDSILSHAKNVEFETSKMTRYELRISHEKGSITSY